MALGRGQAQEPATVTGPVTMELGSPLALTEEPLSVQADLGRWFPVAVTLSNRGEPIQGTLSMHLYSSRGSQSGTSRVESPVDLPSGASKRVWLYGRLERAECDTVEVSLRGDNFETISRRFALRMSDSATRLVLAVNDTGKRLSSLAGLRGRGLGISEKNTGFDPGGEVGYGDGIEASGVANRRLIQAFGASSGMIPDRWIGFDSLHAIVLQDFVHDTLTKAQSATLRGFVATGGELIVLGGANWQHLAKSPLADLWPIKPVASSLATAAEKSDLVNHFVTGITPPRHDTFDRLDGAPVAILRGELKPNARLQEGRRERPIIASLHYGAGYVRMLAFDPSHQSLAGWNGQSELWRRLFENVTPPNRLSGVDAGLALYDYSENSSRYAYQPYNAAPSGATGSLLQQIVQTPQLRTPPVSYIAWFLALYVFVLVPVNYCILRFFDRREWAWVTVPLIVVSFSAVSYAAALRIKGNVVRTRLVNIVQGSQGPGQARVDSMLWLFSPRRDDFTVTGADVSAVVAPYIDFREDSGQGTMIGQPSDSSFAVQDYSINMWDWKTFVGRSVVDLKNGISIERKGDQLLLTNGSPYDLRGCVLAVGGSIRRFGDVGAGESAMAHPVSTKGTMNDSVIVGSIIRESRLMDTFSRQATTNFENIAQAALSLALERRGGRTLIDEPLLVAWGQKSVTSLQVQGEDPQAEELTLFLLRLPNDAKYQGPSFRSDEWMTGHLVSSPVNSAYGFSGDADALPPGVPSLIPSDRWTPRNLYYDFKLPLLENYKKRSEIKLSVSGSWYRNHSDVSGNPPISITLWDFIRQNWVPVSPQNLKLSSGDSSAFTTGLYLKNAASFVRSPDPLIKLRITTREQTVRLQSAVLQSR